MMTEAEKLKIDSLRASGLGARKIAQQTGMAENAVKSYLRRKESTETKAGDGCLNCGKDVGQRPGRKKKKFCCDKCRTEWWSRHTALMKRKAVYRYTCPECGNDFVAYGNSHRKYCSRKCYMKARFGEETGDDDRADEKRDAV